MTDRFDVEQLVGDLEEAMCLDRDVLDKTAIPLQVRDQTFVDEDREVLAQSGGEPIAAAVRIPPPPGSDLRVLEDAARQRVVHVRARVLAQACGHRQLLVDELRSDRCACVSLRTQPGSVVTSRCIVLDPRQDLSE